MNVMAFNPLEIYASVGAAVEDMDSVLLSGSRKVIMVRILSRQKLLQRLGVCLSFSKIAIVGIIVLGHDLGSCEDVFHDDRKITGIL